MSSSERIAPSASSPVGQAGRPARHPPGDAERRPAWLTIHDASALIGVSEATLRRWAEAGDVEVFVTPGGHRRFTRAALLKLLPRPGRPHRTLRELGETEERIVGQYRRDVASASSPASFAQLDDTDREAFRDPGRRMLGAVLGYLDAPTAEAGAEQLAGAVAAATDYGTLARRHGLGSIEATDAFLRFRTPFLSELATIARRRRLDASEANGLIIAAASLFDRLLLALLEGHASASGAGPAVEPAPVAATPAEG